jgi:integrase
MPRKVSKALTPLQVKNAKPGRHADGDGLYLLVKETGAKSWVFRFMLGGKSRDLGLSRCPEAVELLKRSGGTELTLAQARDVASMYRLVVREGKDPLQQREAVAKKLAADEQAKKVAEVTFQTAAETFLAGREGTWRNPKHRQQWYNTLATHVYPKIGATAVSEIETSHVLSVLEPIWKVTPETAKRIQGRIEVILDAARVRGYRKGENPARWRGHLAQILPARNHLSRGHHEAMPYASVPTFLKDLRQSGTMAAFALEFTILTAARTGEVIGATWDEVDFEEAVWTIPALRMKAGREHRVPLSPAALDVLNKARLLSSQWLFQGQRGGPLSNMAMAMILRRRSLDVTVHGFRSAFRDWAGERTAYPDDVCEAALAHIVASKSKAAYFRTDLFEKRRQLMEDWSVFCERTEPNNVEVIPLRKRSA